MIHTADNIKDFLRHKPRNLFDSKNNLSAACSGTMARRETGGPEQDLASRLRLLRAEKGFSGPRFAEWIGVEYPRWNNYERGYPLPAPIALILCQKFPGLTLDWLYRGRLEGMTLDLVRRLEVAESGKSTTA